MRQGARSWGCVATRKVLCIMSFVVFAVAAATPVPAYQREIQNLSATLAGAIAEAGKRTIAVVDFTDLQGNVTELGRFLAEELSVALAASGKGFEVVDRTHLKVIVREHKLQLSDFIDPKTAAELGRIAGVHALITGTITPFGDSVRLSAKILDASTARVIGASATDIAKTKAVDELLARGLSATAPTAPAVSTSTSVSSTTVDSARFQDFPQFRVAVASLRRLSGGRVELVLNYMNKTSHDYILSIPTWCSQTQFMSDEAGNDYKCDNFVGLGYYFGPNVPFSGLTLPAGRSATASLRFNPPQQMATQGSKFSFNGQHFLLSPVAAGRPKIEATYVISILNIEPQ